MAKKYYAIADRLPETPEIPFSFRHGTFDDDNKAPKGAEVVGTKKELNKILAGYEKENEAAIELSTELVDAPVEEAKEAKRKETKGKNNVKKRT